MAARSSLIAKLALAIAIMLLLLSSVVPLTYVPLGEHTSGCEPVELIFRIADKCLSAALRARVGDAFAYKVDSSRGVPCSGLVSFEAPAPYYVLTGDLGTYRRMIDALLARAFSWEDGALYMASLRHNARWPALYRPNLYVFLALELLHAYIAIGNASYLEAARLLAHRMATLISPETGLPPYEVWSNGTVKHGAYELIQPMHVGICLITLGKALGERELVKAGLRVVNAIRSLASPFLPLSVWSSNGRVADPRAYPLPARVPCSLADGLLLLFYLGRDAGELKTIARWLCDYYLMFSSSDPYGLFSCGRLDYRGAFLGQGTYTFVNQFNQLRFVVFWAFLTGNRTLLSFAERVVNKIERHFNLGRAYVGELGEDLAHITWSELEFISVMKYLSLLLELYMATGNATYTRLACHVAEETLPIFEFPYGYARLIDVWTCEPEEPVQLTATLLIAASEALCTALIGPAKGCLPYLLPARGLKVPWAGYVDVRERVARFVVDVFADEGQLYLPYAKEARVDGGGWRQLEGGWLSLPKGRHVIEARYPKPPSASLRRPSLISPMEPAYSQEARLDDGRLLPRGLRGQGLAHHRR